MNRPCLILLLLSVSLTANSRPPKRDKRFALRNTFYQVNYQAEKGRDGLDGSARLGSLVPLHPPCSGRDGKTGHTGPNLFGRVSALRVGDSVILVIVIRKDKEARTNCYYVNPRYGKIIIDADGGDGGAGGWGACGSEKNETNGGDGGNGGVGGKGGAIDMTFDSTAVGYVHCSCIIYFNRGGRGGSGGHGGEGKGGCSKDGQYGMNGENGIPGAPVSIRDPSGRVISPA